MLTQAAQPAPARAAGLFGSPAGGPLLEIIYAAETRGAIYPCLY